MELLEEFAKYKMNIQGIKQVSINIYMDTYKELFDFLKINENDIDSITKITFKDVQDYLTYLAEEVGNTPATRNRKLATIKSLFNYLYMEKCMDIDYRIFKIKKAKKIQKEKEILTPEEAQTLLTLISNAKDKAFFTVLLSTGARVSEALQIKVDDIYVPKSTGEINCKDTYYSIILGKGNKERKLYLDNINYNTLAVCRRYAETTRKKVVAKYNVKTDNLFIGKFGGTPNEHDLNLTLKRWCKRAEINKNITLHSLRHTYATNLAREGVPINVLRDSLGHGSIETTNTYLHTTEEDKMRAMEGTNKWN